MSWDGQDDDDRQYVVVVNHEEQYSIWLADRKPPAGWRVGGPTGDKQTCLRYIDEVWTDMRPLSLRQRMAQATSSTDTAHDSSHQSG